MTKEGSTKIINFMIPGAGVLMLGRGHISYNLVSFTLSIYSTLVAFVLRNFDAVFLFHRWFSFILWWGCWYTNMRPSLWQDVSVKSLILGWPLRPLGILFKMANRIVTEEAKYFFNIVLFYYHDSADNTIIFKIPSHFASASRSHFHTTIVPQTTIGPSISIKLACIVFYKAFKKYLPNAHWMHLVRI